MAVAKNSHPNEIVSVILMKMIGSGGFPKLGGWSGLSGRAWLRGMRRCGEFETRGWRR